VTQYKAKVAAAGDWPNYYSKVDDDALYYTVKWIVSKDIQHQVTIKIFTSSVVQNIIAAYSLSRFSAFWIQISAVFLLFSDDVFTWNYTKYHNTHI